MSKLMPRIYGDDELREAAVKLKAEFNAERRAAERELAEFYHNSFSEAFDDVAEILSRSSDLSKLDESGKGLLMDGYLPVMRSMDRPTVSDDDFKCLSGTETSARNRFRDDELASDAIEYLRRNLNMDLFPWIGGDEAPSEEDRRSACMAVAALIADQKTKTSMRGSSSRTQEDGVREALRVRCGMTVVDGDSFSILSEGPKPGQVFSRETKVAETKADVVLGLYDGRIMCLECKVSNSTVNSYKRLNHEVLDKVTKWTSAFGRQCVSGAVLKGVFSPANLISAQGEGAYLFWSSDLSALVDFVNGTKGSER